MMMSLTVLQTVVHSREFNEYEPSRFEKSRLHKIPFCTQTLKAGIKAEKPSWTNMNSLKPLVR